MTRIAVLGNSHVAALKLAWDSEHGKYPGVELTFFAHIGWNMEGMIVRDGVLVPDNEALEQAIKCTSGGQDRVDPREYDAILLYGLGLLPYRPPAGFFSQAVLSRAVQDHVRRTPSFLLLNRLRQISDLPIFVVLHPLRALTGAPEPGMEGLYPAGMQMIETVLRPFNVTLLRQPPSTMCAGFYTRHEFSIGSIDIAVKQGQEPRPHAEGEALHMNKEYGAIFLETHLRAIADEAGGMDATPVAADMALTA